MSWCQCEHEGHGGFRVAGVHGYGVAAETTPVPTAYGTFDLCAECRYEGHMVDPQPTD